MIHYTGVGARIAPDAILNQMRLYGMVFAKLGYILRSGGANGADTAFEHGSDAQNGTKEIYLPWEGFNNNTSPYFSVSDEAFKIAEEVYGRRWDSISIAVKSLMARNIYQVIGLTLDTPSKFLLCWTPDGATSASSRTKSTGGTGQAIACASMFEIPVFNLWHSYESDLLLDFIGDLDD